MSGTTEERAQLCRFVVSKAIEPLLFLLVEEGERMIVDLFFTFLVSNDLGPSLSKSLLMSFVLSW